MYCGSVYYCGSNLLILLKIDDYVDPKQLSEIVHRALRNVKGVANLVTWKRAVPNTDHDLHLYVETYVMNQILASGFHVTSSKSTNMEVEILLRS